MIKTAPLFLKRFGSLLPRISCRQFANLESFSIFKKAEGTYFEELDEEGFLISGNYYRGGVLAFNDLVLLWDVNTIKELSPESLKAVTLINPPINMLFIGTGKYTTQVPNAVIEYLHKFGISVESMSTSSAAANFNFLHDDNARVAAALIPEQPSEKIFEIFVVCNKHLHN